MVLPDFSFEKELHEKGFKFIAGVDEVGRGCFAGPVVAGCVVFNNPITQSTNNQINKQIKINDSKKLTSGQREVADVWIRENAYAFGIGQASVAQINKLGIKKATEIAFRQAIKNCKVQIDHLLIDAFYIPYVRGLKRKNQKAIIRGDGLSISIAAASIVAKVYRDKLMTKLSQRYGKYHWDKNKGYGTKDHRDSIRKHGLTKHHRKLFVRNYVSSLTQ